MTDEVRAIMCVTNSMGDFRSCCIRGEHTLNCDGREYAWNEARGREETTGKLCKGCRPREARIGHLCLACWEHVEQALSAWPMFEMRIDGVSRAVQRDNGGISGQSIGYVPIPGTVLALDEVRSYYTLIGNADQWVNTVEGAMDARRFARALEAAMRTHPAEERAHKLRRLRCPSCKTLTFVWNPPERLHGDITVTCQNPGCGKAIHEHDRDPSGTEKLDIIATIEAPPKAERSVKGLRSTSGRQEFAEQYDPAREDHADLDPLSILTKADLRAMLDPDTPRLNNLRKTELIDAVRETA